MAKTKQKAPTAAQRRERERQQRPAGSQNSQSQARNRGPMQRKSSQRQWLFIGGVLLLVAIIIGAFVVISRAQSGTQGGPTQASSEVFNDVTRVDPNVLAVVGSGNVQNPLRAVKGSPPIVTGPTGKPEFLYIGAEYCPFCAGQHWPIVVALSRFGTFSKLYQTTSSSTDAYPNTPTFTFSHAVYGGSFYTSSYIDFVSVELQGNQQDATGNYPTLETPTADQQHLLNTYDAPPYTNQAGSIPFIDIGNRYIAVGLAQGYSPQDLAGLQWKDIASDLVDSNTAVSKGILGTANYLTAGICMITQQQPGSVCNTAIIQTLEQSLGKSTMTSSGTQIAVAGNLEAVVRRKD